LRGSRAVIAVLLGGATMKVRKIRSDGQLEVELLDPDGIPVEVVAGFLRYLAARNCSPNTVTSYAYDLLHLWRFLAGGCPEFRGTSVAAC